MKYQPHEYQQYAIDWIVDHPVSALFLDMGLGKTSITLTALQRLLFERFESRRVLIIAPLRVARDTWKAEAEKWDHLQGLRLSIAVGDAQQRCKALENTEADIYVINRENVPWLVQESGLPFDYDTVVIDELSSFKNHTSKRYKALASKRKKISRIIGLTGTPSVNGLEDLWAEIRLLDMGERLGKYVGPFRSAYEVPDKRSWNIIYSYKPKPGAVDQIREKISDIAVSMKSVDHLEMPELISAVTEVRMSPREREEYEDLKEEYVMRHKDVTITAANAAVLSGKLAQLANGAIYDDEHVSHAFHERKLDALEDLIEAMNGRPVLVAYWFRHDYERIVRRLQAMGVSWNTLETSAAIDTWNRGDLQVGLIHPASAGHGLNLQSGGNHLIWFGLTWSLELYQQTNARLWRQGQKAETVVIQHIVTANSIDVDILDALEKKNMNQDALIEAVKARVRK